MKRLLQKYCTKDFLIMTSLAMVVTTVWAGVNDAYYSSKRSSAENVKPTAGSCSAQEDLLIKSSNLLDVRMKTYSFIPQPIVWEVYTQSKDSKFSFITKNNNLCIAYEKAWEQLEAYNAYVLKIGDK